MKQINFKCSDELWDRAEAFFQKTGVSKTEQYIQALTLFLDREEARPNRYEGEYEGLDVFSKDLRCTVRECIGCKALVIGGPTRCRRCAIEGDPQSKVSDPIDPKHNPNKNPNG